MLRLFESSRVSRLRHTVRELIAENEDLKSMVSRLTDENRKMEIKLSAIEEFITRFDEKEYHI